MALVQLVRPVGIEHQRPAVQVLTIVLCFVKTHVK